jgi:hypothetical protein
MMAKIRKRRIITLKTGAFFLDWGKKMRLSGTEKQTSSAFLKS